MDCGSVSAREVTLQVRRTASGGYTWLPRRSALQDLVDVDEAGRREPGDVVLDDSGQDSGVAEPGDWLFGAGRAKVNSQPRRLEFVDAIPRSAATGQIQRHQLAARLQTGSSD
jgi:hypothetical protein